VTDLSRIPQEHRARVEREMDDAAQAASTALWTAGGGVRACHEAADKARAAVLARYIAIADEADAAAAKARAGFVDDVFHARREMSDSAAAEAEAAARAEVWARRMAEVESSSATVEQGPFCEWPQCTRPISGPPRQGCGSPYLHRDGKWIGPGLPDVDAPPPDPVCRHLSLRALCPKCIKAAVRRVALDHGETAEPDAPHHVTPEDEPMVRVGVEQKEAIDTYGQRADGTRDRLWTLAIAPARIEDVTEPGAAMMLDALVRYLADKPVEALRAIAALVKTLPVGLEPSVNLGSRTQEGYDLIAGQPGARHGVTRFDEDDDELAYVSAVIDGVQFSARYRRPMTAERAQVQP
jgi:hypothetical protein